MVRQRTLTPSFHRFESYRPCQHLLMPLALRTETVYKSQCLWIGRRIRSVHRLKSSKMRTAYFWCRNTLFRFAVNHKPLLQIFGEIGELVQPRYKRGIDKYRDSNLSFAWGARVWWFESTFPHHLLEHCRGRSRSLQSLKRKSRSCRWKTNNLSVSVVSTKYETAPPRVFN